MEATAGPDAARLVDQCLDNTYGEVAIVNNQDGAIRRADVPGEGDAQPDQSTALTVERGRPLGELQTEPAPGEVKLWVSNQSFTDDPVHLTVSIGEVTVVEENFEVQGQHNWVAFDINGLEPGTHTIVAASDTGATRFAEFTVSVDEPRWLVLDYWYSPEDLEDRHFTFGEFDQAVAFG